jgi:hypothetical protein
MSDQAWFVSQDGKSREGPLTQEEVRARLADGRLTRSGLVWREGMGGWVLAATVPELGGDAPPPLPGVPQVRLTIPPGELQPAPAKGSGAMVGIIIGAVVLGLGCLIVVPLMVGIMLPALGKARSSARQIKDSTQVRGIHQGMVLWAQGNSDTYQVPSQIDRGDSTIAAADGKDLPRHITSILIFNGFISPEVCVSPAEASGQYAVYQGYQYSNPAGAASPAMALWDPAFKAYPTESANYIGSGPSTPGGLSYAFMPPLGARRKMWSNTFTATEAIIGNRGPAYDPAGTTWGLHPTPGLAMGGNNEVGTGSVTLLIHGGPTSWEGNICYNDNHTNFETAPDPPTLMYRFGGSAGPTTFFADNLFVNENDVTRAKDGSNDITGPGLNNANNLLRGWNSGRFGDRGELIDIPAGLWFD